MTKRLNHTIFSTFLDLLEIFGFVRPCRKRNHVRLLEVYHNCALYVTFYAIF
jgi:hypothetical protein